MSGVGGVSGQQQVQDLQNRDPVELRKAGQPESRVNLSVEHRAGGTVSVSDAGVLSSIPFPEKNALTSMNAMDSSDLQALISGLRVETEQVQSDLQIEDAKQNQSRTELNNSRKAKELHESLQQVESENKCAQQTAKICCCIPGINLLVGVPAKFAAKAGENKADAIRAEIMTLTHGPEVGEQMVQFMKDYKKEAEKDPDGLDKAKLHMQLNQLHQAGALDNVAFYEISHIINGGLADAGEFGTGSAMAQRLTDLATGVRTPMFAAEAYPPGMLEAENYILPEEHAEELAAGVTGYAVTEAVEVSSTVWLTDLARKMQGEEQGKALSQLQLDIEEAQSSVLQSNSNSLKQAGMQQRLI